MDTFKVSNYANCPAVTSTMVSYHLYELNSPNSLHSCGALSGELGAGPSTVTVLLTKPLTSFNFNFVALNAGLVI